MSRAYDKHSSSCDGCGTVAPPWELKERTVMGTLGEFCKDCRGESIYQPEDSPHFIFDDDAEVNGEPYPRVAADYSTQYEASAFGSAVVNEVVR